MKNSNIRNIYYKAGDYETPSGGMKRIYRHVKILANSGYSAYVLHDRRPFTLKWFTSWLKGEVKFAYLSDRPSFKRNDVLVIPEVSPHIMDRFKRVSCECVVFNMNSHHVYRALQEYRNGKFVNWREFGIKKVITPSKTIKQFTEYSMNIPTEYVGASVDKNLFYVKSFWRQPVASYMYRKGEEIRMVEKILQSRGIKFKFNGMKKLSEKEFAAILRRSEIYLAGSSREGIHQSCLEAMACGCIVVGYAGIGGKEYLKDGYNCFLVENGDVPAFAKKLEYVIRLINKRDKKIVAVRKNAIKTALGYDLGNETNRILKFWDKFTFSNKK